MTRDQVPDRGAHVVRDFLRRRHSFVDALPSPAHSDDSSARRRAAAEWRRTESETRRERILGARPPPVQHELDLRPRRT